PCFSIMVASSTSKPTISVQDKRCSCAFAQQGQETYLHFIFTDTNAPRHGFLILFTRLTQQPCRFTQDRKRTGDELEPIGRFGRHSSRRRPTDVDVHITCSIFKA